MNTKQITTISVATDFSKYPAGRYPEDGEFNGTKFRKDSLVPPLRESNKVVVIFDGVAGLGSSFLEEAFGGLIREEGMTKAFLDEHLQLLANEEELKDFIELANKYIEDASRN